MSEQVPELIKYDANCHCGAVKFTVKLEDVKKEEIMRCNCSICTKNGYLLVYPQHTDVKFIRGEDKLSAYRFGNKNKPHRFCSECGTSILIDFSESPYQSERQYTAINLRTFVNVEDYIHELKYIDGNGKKNLKPEYTVPE